jgi:ectoine hydroxylase-related dioxygenase (phytanoyl-CoA dioxygenase family)
MAPAMDLAQDFQQNGFVRLKGFLSPAETATLLADIQAAQAKAATSRLDKNGMTFRHNLWRQSQQLRDFIASEKVVHALRGIIGPDFWVRWDQAVEKQPGGAAFPWHQDNGYNGLQDGHYQFWVAVSRMTRSNGGLWLQRGSHARGRLPHHFIGTHLCSPGDEQTAVFIDAEPGDAVLFSSFLLHKTDANTTDEVRLAYVIEYMRLSHVDPFIEPPFFQVARGGEPAQAMLQRQPAWFSPRNQLKYFVPRLRRGVQHLRSRLSAALRRKSPASQS